ncbi:hypothetical protein KSP40_PGU015928 [Platanthera guangdongensis]|uniref:FAF domain-containing protein n=1 Tax=Platanthera guangdongensis TaxID=2320717 RepID=A0ABR2LJM1_9ASPA
MADISVSASQASVNRNQRKEFSSGYQFGPPELPEPNIWLPEMANSSEEKKDSERLDIWSSIQNEKQNLAAAPLLPYIHPFARFSSCLMSQKSLEICTESLGSETGSDGFSSGDEMDSFFFSNGETEEEENETEDVEKEEEDEEIEQVKRVKRELFSVNYHCSVGRRSPPRSFPPPLPSISRRDGPCLKMRPRRLDGRLVVEAVPVPSQNYLHAERHGGRLLLSFIDTSSFSNLPHSPPSVLLRQEEAEEEELEEEEEEAEVEEQVVEEEVEVVDRGTIVEVKVSGLSAVKVHRSSLVINKFVVGSPLTAAESPPPAAKRASAATTTAAAAAVAASSISVPTSTSEGFHYNYLHHHHNSPWGSQSPAAAAATDAKLLFTSKRLAREDLLHDMRRCSELRRPLFIFEQPHCIATSS